MTDSGGGPKRTGRGSGPFIVHTGDELEVYFNEVAHGRPVGFVASAKWRPRADVYETADTITVLVDIAGMEAGGFTIEFSEGVLTIAGERQLRPRQRSHYHAMEVQAGPFERRLRLPVPVDPASMVAQYTNGMLEVRLGRIPERRAGSFTVKPQ